MKRIAYAASVLAALAGCGAGTPRPGGVYVLTGPSACYAEGPGEGAEATLRTGAIVRVEAMSDGYARVRVERGPDPLIGSRDDWAGETLYLPDYFPAAPTDY